MAASTSTPVGAVLPRLEFPKQQYRPYKNCICGRIVHASNGEPFRKKYVTVKAGVFSEKIRFITDQNGYFQHNSKKFVPIFGGKTTLIYKIYESNVFYIPDTNTPERILVDQVKVKLKISSAGTDIGTLCPHVYEYQNGLPDLQQPLDFDRRPQHWPYLFNLITASFDEILKNLYASIDHFDTVEEVQNAFKASDKHLKVSTETTIEMMLNGIFAANFLKGPGNILYVNINWDQYEKKARPQIPNVKLTLTNIDKTLDITHVTVTLQDGSLKVFEKNDPDFHQGLYLFNCAALVRGEVDSHLTKCHFWTGQVAMAVFRSLSDDNPVKIILAPHLKGVLEINRMGADAIFGPNGVLSHSGLSVEAIQHIVRDNLGSMCYKTFSPRFPINEQHRSAHAGRLFWKILNKVVRQYVKEREPLIITHWNEIYCMSHNLVTHSPAYRPLDDVQDHSDWFDPAEIDDPLVPGRVVVDGELKAIRPITLEPAFPTNDDMDNLVQLICTTIFIAVEEHDVRHRSQAEWLTNLNFGSIAPNNDGKGPFGGVDIKDAQAQMTLAKILTDFESDSLVDNVFGDIHEPLIKELLLHKEEFASYGQDITKVSYGIVI